jgi:hypothetical protein
MTRFVNADRQTNYLLPPVTRGCKGGCLLAPGSPEGRRLQAASGWGFQGLKLSFHPPL